MSELNSLFAKVSISKEQFEAFLRAAPSQPTLDENWTAWWDARSMYGKKPLEQSSLRKYNDNSNGEIIEAWKANWESISYSEYDEATEMWHLAITYFSENYLEMLPMLAFLKSIAIYKKDNPGDFSIVYNWFWGDDDVNAYMTFEKGVGLLVPEIKYKKDVPIEKLEYANGLLQKKQEEFEQNNPPDWEMP